MMARGKRNGPRASGIARRAGNVPCGKRTDPLTATAPVPPNAFMRRRFEARIPAIIARHIGTMVLAALADGGQP